MKRPRDHSALVTVGGIRLARTFSNIVSPPVIFAVLGLALAWHEVGFWSGFAWAALFGFWVSLAPILFVVYLLRTKRISDLHMNTPRERRLPYVVSVVGAGVATALFFALNGPQLLSCLGVLSIFVLGSLGLINMVWLISIHTTSIAAAAVIATLVFDLRAGAAVSIFVILVAWARLYLRRHTLAQVVAGLLVGSTSVLIIRALGCFS
ncbi:MAG: phosphatase PAP2 family protein [Candidatus Promineifilaceae bacterium]|nr:phosphatase PAP2 family protein [Candidatus Promineifilaceae bacterium]